MLEKLADIGVAKDDQGLVLVDRKTSKGVRMPNEVVLQLTIAVWELSDKLNNNDIVKKITEGSPGLSAEQTDLIKKMVDEALEFFVRAGWAKSAVAPQKAEKPVKKPAKTK